MTKTKYSGRVDLDIERDAFLLSGSTGDVDITAALAGFNGQEVDVTVIVKPKRADGWRWVRTRDGDSLLIPEGAARNWDGAAASVVVENDSRASWTVYDEDDDYVAGGVATSRSVAKARAFAVVQALASKP